MRDTIQLAPIRLKPLPDDFELREVQDLSINMIRGSYGKGFKRTILHLATSGGKTILAGMLFRKVFEKNPTAQCWFIAPRITLLTQTKKEFEDIFGYDCGIVQGDTEIDLSKHVQIATIQTLANRLTSNSEYVWSAFNRMPVAMVAGDEAHLQFAGHQTVWDAWEPHMLGLTATPFSKGLGLFWEDMVRPKRMADLIKEGVIADYRVKACVSIDRAKLGKTTTGEYTDADVEDETNKIIGDVFKEWNDSEDMKGRPFLGFTQTIATCIALSNLFNESGANTAFVHSKMSDEDVQDTLDAFKAGHYDGVFSVVKLIEGFNFPAASAMLDCAPLAPSKSDPNMPNAPARYVQKTGRVVRTHDDKDYALIHDHVGNFAQYGGVEFIEDSFPTLDKTKKGEPKVLTPEERKEKAVRECSKCGMIVKGKICNICGFVTKKPTQFLEAGDLEFVDGEMVEIKKVSAKKKDKKPKMEKVDFAAQLKTHCNNVKLKKPTANVAGMYKAIYKNYFNVWPRGDTNFDRILPRDTGAGFDSYIKSQNIRYAKSQVKK